MARASQHRKRVADALKNKEKIQEVCATLRAGTYNNLSHAAKECGVSYQTLQIVGVCSSMITQCDHA
jgi:NH3-dependent NAD+ synthetase